MCLVLAEHFPHVISIWSSQIEAERLSKLLKVTQQARTGLIFKARSWYRAPKYSAWRTRWHPTPVLLPGKSHGRRSPVGCSPWGRKELNMTERLHFHFSLPYIGEGNGNPLQCSCLENPRDGGAWWAAVYGVSQSRTRLKRPSSSSSSSSSSIILQSY